MKALFAHDHIFSKDGDGLFYSEGKLPYSVWLRYLEFFDQLIIAGRSKEINHNEHLKEFSLSSGPNVEFVELPNLSHPIQRFSNYNVAYSRLEKAVIQADAVIARLPSEIGSLSIKIAQKLHKPWAVEVVGCAWDALWNYGNWKGKVYAPFALFRTKKLIRYAPYAIYVTNTFLQRRYPSVGKTIACSDVDILSIDIATIDKRIMKIDSPQFPIKIGLIGSLSSEYKGIDTALLALREINDELPPYEFHILGGGEQTKWHNLAKNLDLEKKTIFCGTLPRDEVLKWLDSVDLYLQPSLTEGLPRATIEAMSRGLPIVGSTAGGIPELLDEDILFKPGDYKQLSSIILKVVKDKDIQIKLSKSNLNKALNYTKDNLDLQRNAFWKDFCSYVKVVSH